MAVAAVEPSDIEEATAPVIVDGNRLFRVRGASSYPPEERAEAISGRIIELARNPSADVSDIRIVDTPTSSDLVAGQRRLMSVLDADAEFEGFDRRAMAAHIQDRVRRSIEDYRQHRTPAALKKAAEQAAITTAIFVPVYGYCCGFLHASVPPLNRDTSNECALWEFSPSRFARAADRVRRAGN